MQQPYQITTDVLEQQFGVVKAKIMFQTDQKRLVCVYAVAENKPLEYALVHFNLQVAQQYNSVHNDIVIGGLMGKTFRAAGIAFEREELASFLYDLPIKEKNLFGSIPGKITVKYVRLRVGPLRADYACNIELYAPDIIWKGETYKPRKYLADIDQLLSDVYKILHSAQ